MSEGREEVGNMTFDDLRMAIERATSVNDTESILQFAEALDRLGSTEASALAADSRATAYRVLGRFDDALTENETAMRLYEDVGDRSGMASVYANIGIVHLIRGETRTGIDDLHRALALYSELGDKRGIAAITGTIGSGLSALGEFDQALEHHLKALEIFEELGSRVGSANTLSNIGFLYQTMGDYPESLRYLFRGLSQHEENGDEHGASKVLINIGNTYWRTGDYASAVEFHYRALEIEERNGDRHGAAISHLMIGSVHGTTKNMEEAFSHSETALEIFTELGVLGDMGKATLNIGVLHSSQSNHVLALAAFDRTLSISEELNDLLLREQALVNLSQVHLRVGDVEKARTIIEILRLMDLKLQESVIEVDVSLSTILTLDGHLDEANRALQSALASAVRIGSKEHQCDVHKCLRDLAQKRNDFAGYIEHNEAVDRITNEIRGQEATRKLAMHAATHAFRTERAEHEKHKALLYNTLPRSIADRVLRGEQVNDSIDEACVMFLDLVGFTTMSAAMEAHQVVDVLGRLFTTCDEICARHQVMKIKTIGDSYMAAAFGEQPNSAVERITLAAREIMSAIQNSNVPLQARIGLHCGPVQAGIIGTERMQYDVWGDTVNVASRMESTGEPGHIHVSGAFAEILRQSNSSQFPVPSSLIERGEIEIKGKGTMTTFYLI
jgi:adenylate cyclase